MKSLPVRPTASDVDESLLRAEQQDRNSTWCRTRSAVVPWSTSARKRWPCVDIAIRSTDVVCPPRGRARWRGRPSRVPECAVTPDRRSPGAALQVGAIRLHLLRLAQFELRRSSAPPIRRQRARAAARRPSDARDGSRGRGSCDRPASSRRRRECACTSDQVRHAGDGERAV